MSINKLNDQIKKQKIKMQALKYKMNNEDNNSIYETLENDYELFQKELYILNESLRKDIETDKKEKFAYKKSLLKVKESLNEFSRVSRTNTKLRKHLQEIVKEIISIDKYLSI